MARLTRRQRAHLASVLRDGLELVGQRRLSPTSAVRAIQEAVSVTRGWGRDELEALAGMVFDVAAAHPELDSVVAEALRAVVAGGFTPRQLQRAGQHLANIPPGVWKDVADALIDTLEAEEQPHSGEKNADGEPVEEADAEATQKTGSDEVVSGETEGRDGSHIDTALPEHVPTYAEMRRRPEVEPLGTHLREGFGAAATPAAAPAVGAQTDRPETPKAETGVEKRTEEGSVWDRLVGLRRRLEEGADLGDVDELIATFPAGWQRRKAVAMLVRAGVIGREQARNVEGLGPRGDRYF